MSLHNEDGIAPDSGVTGPKSRMEEPHELAPDERVEDAKADDGESEHTR